MLRLVALALAFVLIAASATLARDEEAVTLNQRTVYYDVSGDTMTALAVSIKANRPRSMGGFIGETTFYFSWTYDYETRTNADGKRYCQVYNAAVVIDIDVNLPRFVALSQAPADIRRFWRDFIAALEKHELRHAHDFIETGRLIPAALDAFTASSCWGIESKANERGMDFVRLAQLKADQYDDETDHGTREGALFPGF